MRWGWPTAPGQSTSATGRLPRRGVGHPAGTAAEIVREYVDRHSAVAVLACDDADRVLLIKQYRHPIGARDWEIPADCSTGTANCLCRRVAEEADLAAGRWDLLTEFFTSPGGSNERSGCTSPAT